MMNAKEISVNYAIPQSKPTTAAGLPPRALLVKASTCNNALATSLFAARVSNVILFQGH
jgi:hypothetical protein